jgi:hypothetical protein
LELWAQRDELFFSIQLKYKRLKPSYFPFLTQYSSFPPFQYSISCMAANGTPLL